MTSGKRSTWRDSSSVKKPYRLRALDADLNLSEPSATVTAGFVLASVKSMYDDGSNFDSVVAAWDAVDLDTCDFECFLADPGANFTVVWAGGGVQLPASKWAYAEVFTPNAYWRSLGVKTTHRPESATDIVGTSAIWDIPGDAQPVYSGGGLTSAYWFVFRAPVRVEEPPSGMLREYELHAYYNLSVLPVLSGFADCQMARNFVTSPATFNPIPALETPGNYPAWPPLP